MRRPYLPPFLRRYHRARGALLGPGLCAQATYPTGNSSGRGPAGRIPKPALARALSLLVLLALLAACVVPSVEPPASQEPLQLTLLHTNDTWGYLWPCG